MTKVITIGVEPLPRGKKPGTDELKAAGSLLHLEHCQDLHRELDDGRRQRGHKVETIWVADSLLSGVKMGAIYEAEFEVSGTGERARKYLNDLTYVEELPVSKHLKVANG